MGRSCPPPLPARINIARLTPDSNLGYIKSAFQACTTKLSRFEHVKLRRL